MQKASDIHLSTTLPPALRIDDKLTFLDLPPCSSKILQECLTPIELEKFQQNQEIDTTYTFNQQRFRLHAYHEQHGPALAIRIIPHPIPTLEQLQLPEIFQKLCEQTQGLILITGPTGSGKSSSLAAMVQHMNQTQSKHIITLEDPIEFQHTSANCLITQLAVHQHTHSFAQGLRAALRQDPDVIVLGELRDLETIRLALTAAETGHLVLATLHTRTAIKAIDRIVDVFPGNEKDYVRKMLSESLTAVIAQKLLPKPGGGRIAEFEILLATPAIQNLIREAKTGQIYSAMLAGSAIGMRVFHSSG